MRAMRRVAASSVLAIAMACSSVPKYPACDHDGQCATSGKHDYCVAGKCVYCRMSTDCGDRERCRSGKCETDPDLPPPTALDAGDDAAEAGGDDDAGTDSDDETDKTPVNPRQLPRGIRRYLHP
jgi:hypothetical protein